LIVATHFATFERAFGGTRSSALSVSVANAVPEHGQILGHKEADELAAAQSDYLSDTVRIRTARQSQRVKMYRFSIDSRSKLRYVQPSAAAREIFDKSN
jgi:hypothetical protein